jgi:hypothetical protein
MATIHFDVAGQTILYVVIDGGSTQSATPALPALRR